MTLSWNLYTLLLAGYILCFIFFNIIAYLISSFYRKKFNQKSMRFGFLLAILSLLVVIPCLFVSRGDGSLCKIIRTFFLLGGSIASTWNSIVLFLTMKRVRK